MSDKIDLENVPKYKNSVSQNLEAHRQIQKKIDNTFNKVSKDSFNKFSKELEEKNTYFAKSKMSSKGDQNDSCQTRATNYNMTQQKEEDSFCQKCPSLKNHCPHRNKKEQIKDNFSYPILSNSTYGWLPPIDNLNENHNIKSVTKSFYDNSHL